MTCTVVVILFILFVLMAWIVYRDPSYRCWHPGCRRPASACYLSKNVPRGNIEYYCYEHASRHGYCPGCGEFWGGIGSFEFNGWCDHCLTEIRANNFEEHRDEWECY
jgi:hypothetical protein